MHESAITESLLRLVLEEALKHKATIVHTVTVRYGTLANILPEAVEVMFTSMAMGTIAEKARLLFVEEPLRLRCGECSVEFLPENSVNSLYTPCPACKEEFGHDVLSGKELYLDRIEME